MRLFGFTISREKAAQPVMDWRRGWRVIHEPYGGAWQKNDPLERAEITCYPTLYACLNRIASDIGKLTYHLKEQDPNGIWRPVDRPAYSPVLRKPNGYQTAQQFREAWMLSKLIDGNAYILKQRDERRVVTAMYVLDPCRVTPMVTESGRVFYRLEYSTPNNLLPDGYDQGIIPATEIIHDRINPFHHHLIGVPPLCAAALAAGKNLRILRNMATFFANNAQPGGILTAPAGLSDDDADELEKFWNANYTGENSGRIGVIGADLKFTPFAFKAADSQLVEQMRYSDEQICQPFGIPPFKVGIGAIPAGLGVDAINLLYMEDALHGHIKAMEALLSDGLGVSPYRIDMDEAELTRMDHKGRADVEVALVNGKIKTPDEARFKFSLPPTSGGDTLWGQHQDYPLGVLRNRDDLDPVEIPVPEEPTEDDQRNAAAWVALRAGATLKKRMAANA